MTLVSVTFEWDDSMGPCYDCGRPSAYEVEHTSTWTARYCSVCAASQAADGETIVWLFKEE